MDPASLYEKRRFTSAQRTILKVFSGSEHTGDVMVSISRATAATRAVYTVLSTEPVISCGSAAFFKSRSSDI